MKVLGAVGISKTIKASGQSKIFECFFIGRSKVDLFSHIKNRPVSTLFSIFNNGSYRSCTNSFNGTHSKTNCILFVNRELVVGFIHIGAKNIQLHSLAFFHKEGNLLDIVHVVRQHCRHIFRRIMRL